MDEAAIKQSALAEGLDTGETALLLAGLKASRVSLRHPEAWVIGADQMLLCEGIRYDKPADVTAARRQLQALRGRTHTLFTATTCLRAGQEVWRHLATPTLTMRRFTDAWLETYLAAEGEAALTSVGAYRLEGAGVQCFSAIEGEHSAILGLPLLPLLGYLRQAGLLAA